jgi:hypothetical protein
MLEPGLLIDEEMVVETAIPVSAYVRLEILEDVLP